MKTQQMMLLALGVALALSAKAQNNLRTVVRDVVQKPVDSSGDADTSSQKTSPCAGIVVDSEGRPAGGAVVECYQYGRGEPFMPGDWEVQQRVTTDATGAFQVQISRAAAMCLARKPGFAAAWRQWSPSRETDVRLILTATSVLAGVVVDEADKPVGGAEVFVATALSEIEQEGSRRSFALLSGKLARDCFSARTGVDGRFQISGFPTNAAANLDVQVPGKALPQSRSTYPSFDSMQCRAGDKDIRLVIEPVGSVEGKIVVEEPGQPPPVARLWLESDGLAFSGGLPNRAIQSETDGAFVIKDVAAGAYRIRAAFGTNTVPEWVAEKVPVSVESGQTTPGVQVTAIHGGILEVKVFEKTDRKPASQVSVSAYQQGFSASASSGSNGVALLRLLPGDYQVSGYKEDWRSEVSTATVESGQTNRVEIEMSSPSKITGVVRRPDGQPAAGLEVRVVGAYSSMFENIKTDAQGRFEVSSFARFPSTMRSTSFLLVRDPGHNLAAAQELDEDINQLDLQLAPALSIVGRAECDGKPVTNASAEPIFWTGQSGFSVNGLCTGTNIPGRFEIPALPTGRKYTLYVSAPGFGRTRVSEVDSSEAQRVDIGKIELKPANLRLAGQVLDAEDKPVVGALVSLSGEGQPFATARTGREGRFSFEKICEGQVRLSASIMNVISGSPISSRGSTSAEAGNTNVVLKLGESSSSSVVSYSSSKTLKLKGTVTDPTGKPVPGAQVTVLSFGPSNRTKSDGNGTFNLAWTRMSGPSGGSTLIVRDTARNLAAVEELSEETTNLNIQLKPAVTLAGRVEGPAGAPFTNAQVTVMLHANRTYSSISDQPAATDARGRYKITALPNDQEYSVYASAKGHSRSQQKVQVGSETNWAELEPVVLKVAHKVLAGQVLDSNDKPAAGVRVSLSGNDQPSDSKTTDSRGRFHFQVCEGQDRLFASASSGYASVTAEAGDTNVVVQLSRSSSIARQTTTRPSLKGKPLPDLTAVGLAADAVPRGRPLLLCLFDAEQRPSRRCVRLLAEQQDTLKQKGVTVVAVHAAVSTAESWQVWKTNNPVAFPVGCVTDKSDKTQWATATASLPRLILTDAERRVVADGFALDDLDAQLKSLSK